MLRVGFVVGANNASWLGGMNYLRTLLSAVTELGCGEIEPVVLVGHRFDLAARQVLPPVETHETSLLDRFRPPWILRQAAMRIGGGDQPMVRLLKRSGVDVVSHSEPLGRASPFPSVAWIADFQHLHLPELFTARELRLRDRLFHRLCGEAERVIVSSEAARVDLERFHPSAADRARVLHFVVEPPADGGTRPDELRARYGLPEQFLHLPNQLWVHKNHRVVVDALGSLAKAGVEATVVATGDTQDYRRKDFVAELSARVGVLGVEDRFRLLGRVPYADVIGLMRASTAVLNPSLFEGWSTTVEEAKSLGKRVVLSDIPVHREQAPPEAVYFDPRDPEALAEALRRVLAEVNESRTASLAEAARAALGDRRRAFAQRYEEIVREAVAAR